MAHSAHFPILIQLGLNESEALIYELLLEMGRKPAQDLVEPSALGRGNVYNILTSLKKKGLVTEIEGKKTVFEAAPPSKLATLLDRERSKIDQLSASFTGILPLLTSEYNLSTGKPTIQVFEGLDGAERAIFDSLESKTEILTYLDAASLSIEKFAEVNKRYLKKRIEKQINKRILVEDSPITRAFFEKQNTPFTQVAFVPNFAARFNTAMEIYDGAVSYLTMSPERQISMLIRDKNIYDMHRAQFDFLWNLYFKAGSNAT